MLPVYQVNASKYTRLILHALKKETKEKDFGRNFLIFDFRMSQVRVHSLLGDSNIRRHINQTSRRASASIKAAQFISCGHLEIFADSLKSVREETNVCIISCLTNFIASVTEGPVSISERIEPVLQDALEALFEVCESNPTRHYLVSPPMYRSTPVWYREGLPEVLTLFSQLFTADRPDNLHVMSSFPTPEYDSSGVHLTPYSGLQFLLYLFDGAQELLNNLTSSTPEIATRTCEVTRLLQDRVMVLEQDHRRLNKVVEHQIAIESELADFRQNERYEDCFLIAGVPRIPDDFVGKEWQVRAVAHVQDVLKILMGSELPILFVKNATKRYKDAEITFNVKMVNLSDAKAIRRKSGSFFLGGQDKRPKDLKHISIKNFVTPETNTRISIMKLMAKRYRDSNQGCRAQVISYDPRPMLKITPSASSSDEDKRAKSFNYVEAVLKLPTNFSPEEIDPIIKRINPGMVGRIRSTFIIITDDRFKQLTRVTKAPRATPDAAASEEQSEEDQDTEMAETNTVPGVSNPNPGIPAPTETGTGTKAASSTGSRNSRKRGASTPGGGAPKR